MQHNAPIVVGLGDDTEPNRELEWAAREAQLRKCPLHLVRAYHLTEATEPWETAFDRAMNKGLQRDAQRVLDAAFAHVTNAYPDITVERFSVDGPPARVLREASEDAEVTVVGSRRLSAVGAAVLGSVSTVVAAAGSGPVVVVRAPAGDPAEQPQVVVGVDGSPSMNEVLGFAFDYASRHQRTLRAVYCWRPDPLAGMQWSGQLPPPPERAERWLGEALAGWVDQYPDVPVHRTVVRAHPVAGLVAESRSQELLVVGARSRHARMAGLLGSASQGVLHHATCPVAVVHPR